MNQTGLMAWSPLGGGSVFKGEDEQSVRLRARSRRSLKHQVWMVVMYALFFVIRLRSCRSPEP
ncbi:MAG: hypothetical protein ACLR5B_03285 [Blautia sp.]